tara:strand:+ start:5251 stop:5835 length:585 start_codon:yes stop_codon:yes gene_type:complete
MFILESVSHQIITYVLEFCKILLNIVIKIKTTKMKKIVLLLTLFFSLATMAQKELPTVDLMTLDGATTTIQEAINKDGVTIVSLWATWCVPCIKELDAISDIYDEWVEETGVSLIAVSVDDSRTVKRVKPLINGKGWEYEILLDTNNDLKRALGASSVPLTIVIKDNKIVYRHSGYNPGAEYELYEKVKEYSSK